MKKIIDTLNKTKLDNRIRLGIMSILVVNDSVDFVELKNMLGVSDGNLASHLRVLEKEKYIAFEKKFVGRKPKTSYRATDRGRQAFEAHLAALEVLLGRKEEEE
ncbi:MAG: transcriptional regulator [Bacteroidetes bacterium]|nr:MAG: transcriptional regulator [Bacteroidota bacterium]